MDIVLTRGGKASMRLKKAAPLTFLFVLLLVFTGSAQVFTPPRVVEDEEETELIDEDVAEMEKPPFSRFPRSTVLEPQWVEVDSLINLDMFEDALKITEKNYIRYKAAGNEQQQLKAAVYKVYIRGRYLEDEPQASIAWMEQEMKTVSGSIRNLWLSYLADQYLRYYNDHQYEILDRTEESDPDQGRSGGTIKEREVTAYPMETWNATQFYQKIRNLYKASLANPGLLQKIPARTYLSLLDTADESPKLRPTYYDLLAHRALAYFQRSYSESGIEPENLTDQTALLPADEFLKVQIKGDDNWSEALRIYQSLVSLHRSNPDALLDLELDRLKFGHEITSDELKNDAYYHALLKTEKIFPQHPTTAEFMFRRAVILNDNYVPKGADTTISAKQRALAVCEEAIKRFPGSRGAELCQEMKEGLLKKSISVTFQSSQLPNQPILSLFTYRNISAAWYKILPAPDSFFFAARYNYIPNADSLKQDWIRKTPAIREGQITLTKETDLETHSGEAGLPELPAGRYMVAMSTTQDFADASANLYAALVNVSGLSLVTHSLPEIKGSRLYVLDAENGKGLSGVGVEITKIDSADPYSFRYYSRQVATGQTGKEGYLDLKELPSGEYLVKVTKGKESLVQNIQIASAYGSWEGNRDNEAETTYRRLILLTDRQVYRPGQTVHFKGILYTSSRNGRNKKVMPETREEIVLFDFNGQKLGTQTFQSNEFGSFTGSFVIPANVLPGQMRLYGNNTQTNQWIRVEEYKRPKFEVTFDPIHQQYKLGQKLTVQGNAGGYSGMPLQNATVRYTITRQPLYYYGKMGYRKPEQVGKGEVKTDDNGSFIISFPTAAYADAPEVDIAYTVETEVTDLKGETQSASLYVNLSKNALDLGLTVRNEVEKKQPLIVQTQASNRSGIPVVTTGSLRLVKLISREEPLIPRKWDMPDRALMTEAEFRDKFPYAPYMNKDIEHKEGEEVFRKENVPSNATTTLEMSDLKKMDEGQYRLYYTVIDSFQDKNEISRDIVIYSAKGKKPISSSFIYKVDHKTTGLKPGDKAEIILGSAGKVKVRLMLEHDGKLVWEDWISIKSGQKRIEFPIKTEYTKNLHLKFFTMVENTAFIGSARLDLYRETKNLNLKLTTFRDKLTPGAQERWQVKITDNAGGPASAEVAAAMYDASLDIFGKHTWESPQEEYDPYNYSLIRFGDFPGQERAYPFLVIRTGDGEITYWEEGKYDMYFEPSDPNGYNAEGHQFITDRVVRHTKHRSGYPAAFAFGDEAPATDLRLSKADPYEEPPAQTAPQLVPRRKLSELAFFFPQLRTNAEGDVVLEFTSPEALTRWRLLMLAHTKDMVVGKAEAEAVTQKDIMVEPNLPRFLREGDSMRFTVKISNMTAEPQTVQSRLQILDPYTNQNIDAAYGLGMSSQTIQLQPKSSAVASWWIRIPDGKEGFLYNISASNQTKSDAEEGFVPVLPRRVLVTESQALTATGKGETKFTFEALKEREATTGTRQPYRLSLEVTSNPAWYAIQALPFLAEYPHECSEQTFNRAFAYGIALKLAQVNPGLRNMLKSWAAAGGSKSPLEKNPELRNMLLAETPWAAEAKSESERMNRLESLFDETNALTGMASVRQKLAQMQLPDGSFPWFEGMPSDRYITQYLVAGISRLEKEGVINATDSANWTEIRQRALRYADLQMLKDYNALLAQKAKMGDDHLTSTIIQYLYARHFSGKPGDKELTKAYEYWTEQARKYWAGRSPMEKAMLILAMGPDATSRQIMTSLEKSAVKNPELGMYWKQGSYWGENQVEAQALIMQAEAMINSGNSANRNAMLTWLLQNKRTNNWYSTKATAEACYSIFGYGMASDVLKPRNVSVTVGGEKVKQQAMRPELASGYMRQDWYGKAIKPEQADISISQPGDGLVFGAVQYQYYDELEEIDIDQNPAVKISRRLYLNRSTPKGPVLEPISEMNPLKVGDLVTVRLELNVDRPLEYMQLRDLRAASLEPVDFISGYKYTSLIGYYQAIKDASMNFFFEKLNRGTFVLEYKLRVSQAGTFQHGFAEIQSMYSPEYGSHSGGISIKVKE